MGRRRRQGAIFRSATARQRQGKDAALHVRCAHFDKCQQRCSFKLPPAAKTLAEREAELKKTQKAKKDAADKAAQEQALKEQNQANCDALKQSLKTLQLAIPLVEIKASGERSYVTDEQKQQRIAKAQQDISTFCK